MRSVPISNNHHYVPKAILRNFCFSGSTTYYIRKDKKSFSIEERNIGSIFKRRHYNSLVLPNGTRNDAVEKFFAAELDNYVPAWIELIEKSILSGKIVFRSDSDRNRFIQFFFNHMKRNPDFIDPIIKKVTAETFHPNFIQSVERDFGPISDTDRDRLQKPETQDSIVNNSRVVNLSKQSEVVLNRLASLRIFAATPKRESKNFIVGSNPVVRFEQFVSQPLGEIGVELWTTLSPKIAVGFAKSDMDNEILYLHDAQVRKINVALARGSSALASNSETLLLSLARANW